MKFKILILLICMFYGCNHIDRRLGYTNGQKVVLPELPLILMGDTISEPEFYDGIRFISMIDGTCWMCMGDYSRLKDVFKQIEKKGFDIYNSVYIKAFDYEAISAPLAFSQFFYPVFIDQYWDIYTLNNFETNIECLLVDNENLLLWAGSIPRSTYQVKKILKIIRRNHQTSS